MMRLLLLTFLIFVPAQVRAQDVARVAETKAFDVVIAGEHLFTAHDALPVKGEGRPPLYRVWPRAGRQASAT